MSFGNPGARAGERGFTLIETMVAGMMLSVLVLGLMGLWASSAHVSSESIVRQKAIFVLNGEMERLTALYELTGFGVSGPKISGGYSSLLGLPDVFDTRYIYPNSVASYATSDFVTSSMPTFKSGAETLVYYENTGLLQPKRNYVWIDRDRGVAARLSWDQQDMIPIGCTLPECDCLNFNGSITNGRCRKVDLILEYPFRTGSGSAMQQDGELKTLVLKTIVGRRE